MPVLAIYLLARTLGTWIGTWVGARLLGEDADTRRWMGPALLPQAGEALGMALLAAQRLPEYAVEEAGLERVHSTNVRGFSKLPLRFQARR